jgi:hypothetical protein
MLYKKSSNGLQTGSVSKIIEHIQEMIQSNNVGASLKTE